MKIISTVIQLRSLIADARLSGKTIGFVPTMGALHEGHLELMRRAKRENDLLVMSIFVNPIQFNNKEDLEKYPRTLEQDSSMLETVGCDFLFAPDVKEMYPEPVNEQYDFGKLADVMEGASRPGHFNGVAIVVRKLLEIVEPDKAYFGEKDFQQLAIIQLLVKMIPLPVEIIPCPIVREADGLAMSSRNMRLTENERFVAPFIYQTLKQAVKLNTVLSPEELKRWTSEKFKKRPEFKVDYIEIAEDQLLQPVTHWNDANGVCIFVAVFLGNVRLIDNMRIF
ncbi:MAG: pantoate--beta-alanine ligase [Bacteroidales bacterium]|nr:pantoate--beta-alanine ligase [Bacteroidales bacterium]